MKIGYARVSTSEQNLDLQIQALRKAGCDYIYQEKRSSIASRPELEKMMEHLKNGDTLIVWRIDRLTRSVKDLIFIIEKLKKRNINFISIMDAIDTNSMMGEFLLHISGAFAQLERSLISERTKAGLKAARERGIKLGRRKGISSKRHHLMREAIRLYEQDYLTVNEICNKLNISTATLYRYLRFNNIPKKKKS